VAAPDLGPWDPLSVTDTVERFGPAKFRWWISGGRALELHVGRSWRDHDDTDVGVPRRDVAGVRMVLDGWDIHVAAAGRLDPWRGQELRPDLHQNNLWCRRHPTGPWCLDVTIAEGDSEAWVYRRDPRIRIQWGQAVLRTTGGVPYLAPELQLLFKSKDPRPKDDVDARQVIPELGGRQRRRLARLLPENHRWQQLLSAAPAPRGE
jgi:hypothetical protein